MCGRFPQTRLDLILQILGDDGSTWDLDLTENVAPGRIIPLLALEDGKFKLVPGKWGFVPAWNRGRPGTGTGAGTRKGKAPIHPINARAETVAENAMFKSAFTTGRCVTETDGFFEWKTDPASPGKQAFWIRRRDRRTTLIAGIQTVWNPPDSDRPERTCALLTTASNRLVSHIHDRMPVCIEPDDIHAWLDPDRNPLDLKRLLSPRPSGEWEAVPIGAAVGNPRNTGPEILLPVGEVLRE